MAADPSSAELDDFVDWLVAQEQAGASSDDILAGIRADYDRRLGEISDAFTCLEEAERQADERPADERLEAARQAALDEAIALTDRPPQRRSTRGDWLAWTAIRKPARSNAPRRLDRRLGCGGRPAARGTARRATVRASPGDDPPDEAEPHRRRGAAQPDLDLLQLGDGA